MNSAVEGFQDEQRQTLESLHSRIFLCQPGDVLVLNDGESFRVESVC